MLSPSFSLCFVPFRIAGSASGTDPSQSRRCCASSSESLQLLCHPLIALRSAHAPLLPEAVEDLMGLHSLHAKRFVGQIAQWPRAALMAAYTGIAVLTLVKKLWRSMPNRAAAAVDLGSRDKPDCTAAVATDSGDLKGTPPLRRLCRRGTGGVSPFFLCPAYAWRFAYKASWVLRVSIPPCRRCPA